MAHVLEIPDPLYRSLVTVAEQEGRTPLEWLTNRLSRDREEQKAPAPPPENQTLADLMRPYLGCIQSSGTETLSEAGGDALSEFLVSKRQEGRI